MFFIFFLSFGRLFLIKIEKSERDEDGNEDFGLCILFGDKVKVFVLMVSVCVL